MSLIYFPFLCFSIHSDSSEHYTTSSLGLSAFRDFTKKLLQIYDFVPPLPRQEVCVWGIKNTKLMFFQRNLNDVVNRKPFRLPLNSLFYDFCC